LRVVRIHAHNLRILNKGCAMEQSPLYLASEVAALLGCSLATLPAKWRRLNRDHGFPRPLPGNGNAWSRYLVNKWIDTTDAERDLPRERRPRRAVAIEQQRQALEARYAGGMV